MGKYIGPSCRKARRVGFNLDLKSLLGKSLKNKCKLSIMPGQHGFKKRKISNYGFQLLAKQSVRFMYGVLERQFKNYYKKAYKMSGITGYNLLIFLECRLDNVVYRMGFASTRAEARQLIVHGFIYIKSNNKEKSQRVDIPSYSVKILDKIFLTKNGKVQDRVLRAIGISNISEVVSWVVVDREHVEGVFLRFPIRDELSQVIDERLIIEFYSK